MSRHQTNQDLQELAVVQGDTVAQREVRQPFVLRGFAFTIAAAVMLVFAIAPMDRESALAETTASEADGPVQSLAVAGDHQAQVQRETYGITKKPVVVVPAARTAPAAGVPDPGTAKAIAFDMVTARGWGAAEYDCLVSLWQKESGWNMYANNPSSGAYGIPQALPGSKMASAGADWATNAATQITWGLGYISARYGTPCGAYSASQAKGWY